MKRTVSAITLIFTTIAPVVMIQPAKAQEQTLAVCNTPSTSIRVYRLNDRPMMRLFNRQNNIVMLDAQAQRSPNPEGINYVARAETTYTLFMPNRTSGQCSLQTSSLKPEFGTISVNNDSSLSTTLAVCKASRNTVRVYLMNSQLMMRAFDSQANSVWLNTVARQEASPGGITYSNLRGEGSYRLYVPSTNDRACSFERNSQQPEFGSVIERG